MFALFVIFLHCDSSGWGKRERRKTERVIKNTYTLQLQFRQKAEYSEIIAIFVIQFFRWCHRCHTGLLFNV